MQYKHNTKKNNSNVAEKVKASFLRVIVWSQLRDSDSTPH